MKRQHKEESLSGPGSHLKNTQEVISFINTIISRHNITSILDLGCGDWNWFKHVNLNGASYEGWDCDDDMVSMLNEKYGNDKVCFKVKDISTELFEKVDLIICRDVLFHIETDIGASIVERCKLSSKYFLSTTFKNVTKNTSIKKYTQFDNWGYYKINLDIEPFGLEPYEIDTVYEPAMKRNFSLYQW